MRTFGIHLVLIVVAVSFAMFGRCAAYSTEFDALLHRVNQIYIEKNGWQASVMLHDHPDALAAMVGNAAFQQIAHAPSTAEGHRRVNQLMADAKDFLSDVARAASFKTKEGKRISGATLFDDAAFYARGSGQDTIGQMMKVYPGQVPNVFGVPAQRGVPTLVAILGPNVTKNSPVSPPKSRPSQPKKPKARPTPRPGPKEVVKTPPCTDEKPGTEEATNRPKEPSTDEHPTTSVIPNDRVCYVGQRPGTMPQEFAAAFDHEKTTALELLALTGHSKIVYGPATWDECWSWIGKKNDTVTTPCHFVGIDEYLDTPRLIVINDKEANSARLRLESMGYALALGPTSCKECWEHVAHRRLVKEPAPEPKSGSRRHRR